MFKFNNSIVPNKVRIGWHFSSNKYAYRKSNPMHKITSGTHEDSFPEHKCFQEI